MKKYFNKIWNYFWIHYILNKPIQYSGLKRNKMDYESWDEIAPYKGKISKTSYENMSDKEREKYTERVKEFAHRYINVSPKKYVPNSNNKLYTPEYSICHYSEALNKDLRKDLQEEEGCEYSNAIKKYSLMNDIVVYRGIDDSVLNQTKEAALFINDVDMYEKGFLHTSLTKATIPKTKRILRILLPKGTCAFYAGNVNGEIESFQEVVVQRGAKLRILGEDEIYINCLLIDTEWLF